ncbi:MAG: hypothetical protein MUF64_31680 [Polyangiaceae bacterium]|nr:hypothetical protein [Polyangiaceae bacterium]
MSSQLSCEPPPVGCEESCLLALPTAASRCMDEVEVHARCMASVPASKYRCSGGRDLEKVEKTCQAEGQAVTACSRKRKEQPEARRAPREFPPPPPIDPSKPDQIFCTSFPGGSNSDIGEYFRKRAEPAGWMFDSVRPQTPDPLYCFRPIPPGAIR